MRSLRFFFSLLMIPVTILFALVCMIGVVTPYINPTHSVIPAFIGLFLPVLLVINFFFFLYWIFQKRWWAIIPIIAIVVNTNYLLSMFQYNINKPIAIENSQIINIASYNVSGFRSWEHSDTRQDIARYIQNEKINVICFQEYKETPKVTVDSLGKLLTLPYHATNYITEQTNYGSAIFSSYPIIASGKIPIPSKTNDAMWADLKIGADTVRIFSCHLQTTNFTRKQKDLRQTINNGEPNLSFFSSLFEDLKQNFDKRASQAELVRKTIDTSRYPVIVCGDFNDTPVSYTYHTIKKDLKDGFRTHGQGYGYTFRGLRKTLRIDFILYAPKINANNYKSTPLSWSDHNLVFMELSL